MIFSDLSFVEKFFESNLHTETTEFGRERWIWATRTGDRDHRNEEGLRPTTMISGNLDCDNEEDLYFDEEGPVL